MNQDNSNSTQAFNTIESEETMVRETVMGNGQTIQTTLVNDPSAEKTKKTAKNSSEPTASADKKKKGGTFKKVVIGGITGITLGSVGAYGKAHANEWLSEEEPLTDTYQEEELSENDIPPTEEEVVEPTDTPVSEETVAAAESNVTENEPVVSEFRVASNVDDNMTFGQAFAAARAEVGPGGMFKFNGQVYSTYYENEWDGMSMEEKTEYGSRVNAYLRGEQPESSSVSSVDTTVQSEETNSFMPDGLDVTNVEVDAETGTTLVHAVMNGQNAVFMDTPDTPGVEFMAVDSNADGKYSEDEIYDISNTGLTTEQLVQGSEFEDFDPNDHLVSI